MSLQACYPGDPYPNYPYHPGGLAPHHYGHYYGTGITTWPQITEDRIREIIREELREALKELKP